VGHQTIAHFIYMSAFTSSNSKLNWSLLGFALSLFIPSTAIFQKYLGIPGVVAYIVIASLALLYLYRRRNFLARLAPKIAERQVVLLTILTFLIMLIAFLVVYPIANSGIFGGGSDGDEALNIATTELLHGHYPYYLQTYLGNPISPLPGAVLLAVPFVLLGNSAYQNFFWLLIFFIAMKSTLKDARSALLLFWAIFALSPIVFYSLLIGSDYISNSLYVLLFVWWMTSSVIQPAHSGWERGLSAVLLGIGLSSRANFVLLLPLVFSTLLQNAGWKSAMKYTVLTCTAFILVTLPFYLYDPQGFSPLHSFNKLSQFQSIVPFAGFSIPLATGIIALGLAYFQPVGRNLNVLFRNCALVLAFPVLSGIVLSGIKSGRTDFSFAFYGVFFLFYGAVSFWDDLFEKPESPT
jgi:hypothetical protein